MNVPVRPVLTAAFALLAALAPEGLLAGDGQWTGSGPEGGPVLALAAVPSDRSTVYLATGRRLYKSVDSGTSWAPTGLSRAAFVLPTWSASVIYAASTGPNAFHRSSDGGETWVDRAGPTGPTPVVSMAADWNDVMTVYAATGDGLFRTTNGGETWEPLPSPVPGGHAVAGIVVDPDDSRVLYFAIAGSPAASGVYRSSDRGATWNQTSIREPVHTLLFAPGDGKPTRILPPLPMPISTGTPTRTATRTTPTRTPTPTATPMPTGTPVDPCAGCWDYKTRAPHASLALSRNLFALTSSGLQVTTNGGESWQRLAPEQQEVSRLAIDPTDSSRLYITSRGVLFHSADGGVTATPVSDGGFGATVGTIVVAGSGVVLAGSGSGAHRSEDAGETWRAVNVGIREVSVRSLAIDPTNPAVLFAGSWGGVYKSRDGGGKWKGPFPGSPNTKVVAIDPTDRSTLYAAGRGVHKSTDGGKTWANKSPEGVLDYIAALLIDPNDARRVFAAHEKIFRSPDETENWEVVLRLEDNVASYYYPPSATAMAIAPSDSATVYAGGDAHWSEGYVSRSGNGGTAWSKPAILGSPVTALVLDSCDARIVYASTYRGVYRSADGGATWNEPGLPEISIYSLVLDPRHSSSLFAGTSEGLFWTNDSGASWSRFEPALSKEIFSLAIDSSGRYLHAGTAEGVFDFERTFEPGAAELGGDADTSAFHN